MINCDAARDLTGIKLSSKLHAVETTLQEALSARLSCKHSKMQQRRAMFMRNCAEEGSADSVAVPAVSNPRCTQIGHWSHMACTGHTSNAIRRPFLCEHVSMPRRGGPLSRQQQPPKCVLYSLRRTVVPRRMSSSAVYIEPHSDCLVLSAPPSQAEPSSMGRSEATRSTQQKTTASERRRGGYTMYSHFVSAKPRL
jgi:hypothetical protein